MKSVCRCTSCCKNTPQTPHPKVYLSTVWSGGQVEPSCGHIGAADGLDLLHPAEFRFGQQLRANETNVVELKRQNVKFYNAQFQDPHNLMYNNDKCQIYNDFFMRIWAKPKCEELCINHQSNICLLFRKVMILKDFTWLQNCARFMIWWFNKMQQGFIGLKQWNDLSYLIKVCYDLIEQTETLQSFLIDIGLCVKLFKIRDGGEHHTHRLIGLVIKVLITNNREITAGRVLAKGREGTRRSAVSAELEKIYELNGDTESKNTYDESLIISERGSPQQGKSNWIQRAKQM